MRPPARGGRVDREAGDEVVVGAPDGVDRDRVPALQLTPSMDVLNTMSLAEQRARKRQSCQAT